MQPIQVPLWYDLKLRRLLTQSKKGKMLFRAKKKGGGDGLWILGRKVPLSVTNSYA